MTGDPNRALIESWQLALHDRSEGTRELYRNCVTWFVHWLAGADRTTDLLAVTRQDVEAWFTATAELAGNTRRTRWVALRSFYGWALDEEEIDTSPMARVKVARPPETPPPVLEVDAVRAMLKACEGRGFPERRDMALLRMFVATGMRLGEAAALKLGDIDLISRVVTITRGKGGKRRVVRFDAATAAAVDRYKRIRGRHKAADLPWLWLGLQGRLGYSGIDAAMERRAHAAGVAHFHVHRLRHFFADRWLTAGGHEGSLQVLGGWQDPKVMARYGAARKVDRALAHYDEIDLLGDL